MFIPMSGGFFSMDSFSVVVCHDFLDWFLFFPYGAKERAVKRLKAE